MFKIKDAVQWVQFAGALGIVLKGVDIAAKEAAFAVAVDSKKACSTFFLKVTIPAIVPRVLGMGRIPAHKEIRNRGLKVEVVKPRQCSSKALAKFGTRRVVGQAPKSGSGLEPGATVRVRYCAKRKQPPKPTTPAPKTEPWSGTWSTSFGNMVLKQTGNKVIGCYERENSTITGTVAGNVLTGTWENREGLHPTNPGLDKGTITFTLSADRNMFSGSWSYATGTAGSSWSGTRLPEDSKADCVPP